ncbi:hypothetical protein TrVFT333_001044 [Trichoderma virens FT-333]|nr:hypothetical protein TrVFT333_001044 [Trichoderma virens FT-333]
MAPTTQNPEHAHHRQIISPYPSRHGAAAPPHRAEPAHPFEKRVWTALCQIPRGRVTTYGLLSAYLGTSPRAVGNALRRNPFAPEVPCHRVVATGGALGGFKGSWPKDGEGITITEKKSLLRGEGVRLDDKGRVLGTVWSGFE